MTTADVLLQYQQRFHDFQAGLASIQSKQWGMLSIAALAVVMTVGFGVLAYYRKTTPLWYPALAISPALVSIRQYGRKAQSFNQVIIPMRPALVCSVRAHFSSGSVRREPIWAGNA